MPAEIYPLQLLLQGCAQKGGYAASSLLLLAAGRGLAPKMGSWGPRTAAGVSPSMGLRSCAMGQQGGLGGTSEQSLHFGSLELQH